MQVLVFLLQLQFVIWVNRMSGFVEYVNIHRLVSRNCIEKCCHGTLCNSLKADSVISDGYLDNTGHLLLWDDGCGGGISPQVTQVMVFFLLRH